MNKIGRIAVAVTSLVPGVPTSTPALPVPDTFITVAWAGVVEQGNYSHATISATWRQVKCHGRGVQAEWVGMGGYASPGLVQTGTMCFNGGYYAWEENLPSQGTTRAFLQTVRPGDLMTATVVTNGSLSETQIIDHTRHWQDTVNLTTDYPMPSADYIVEAPAHPNLRTHFKLPRFSASTMTHLELSSAPTNTRMVEMANYAPIVTPGKISFPAFRG